MLSRVRHLQDLQVPGHVAWQGEPSVLPHLRVVWFAPVRRDHQGRFPGPDRPPYQAGVNEGLDVLQDEVVYTICICAATETKNTRQSRLRQAGIGAEAVVRGLRTAKAAFG